MTNRNTLTKIMAVVSCLLLTLTAAPGARAESSVGSQTTINGVKQQIKALAGSYKGQADKDGSKKAALERLIAPLLALTQPMTNSQKAQNAIGAWHQIWGPYSGNDPTKVMSGLDPDSIYQVISPNGTFTNVAVTQFAVGPKLIGLLKGSYLVEADRIDIRFIEFGFLAQAIPAGYGLVDLPALHDARKLWFLDPADLLLDLVEIPPVGISGSLHEIYSDADLRLTYGTQDGQPGQSLFVHERAPVKGQR